MSDVTVIEKMARSLKTTTVTAISTGLLLTGLVAPANATPTVPGQGAVVRQGQSDAHLVRFEPNGVEPGAVLTNSPADGTHLSARYRYAAGGDQLTQGTDTRGALPVAVPNVRVSLGWFIYIRFSKPEVRGIVGDFQRGVLNTGSAFCGFVPSPYSVPCYVALRPYADSIRNTWVAAYNHHQCMEYRLNYTPLAVVGWRNYNC